MKRIRANLFLLGWLLFGCASISVAEPETPRIVSQDLSALVERAKTFATSFLPDVPAKNYSRGYVSVYFASRTSATPDGVMVSFPIRGSHRTERLGEMEDRIVVVFHDDATKKPDVRKVSRWLYEDSIALKEY